MSMTKKDFTLIARDFNEEIRNLEMLRAHAFSEDEKRAYGCEIEGLMKGVHAIMHAMLEANPRFNRSTFLAAVLKGTLRGERLMVA